MSSAGTDFAPNWRPRDRTSARAEVIDRIADAIPGPRLVALPDCVHFAYLERPDETRMTITAFMTSAVR